MTNKELWDSYGNFSKDLSDNSRKLAFAAVAICWIFRTPTNSFPANVLFALFAVIAFFVFDIMQYFLGALFIKIWTEHQESKFRIRKESTRDGLYIKPNWVDRPAFVCWVLKTISLLTGYIFLGKQVFQ